LRYRLSITILFCLLPAARLFAQNSIDIIDVYRHVIQHKPPRLADEEDSVQTHDLHISILPVVGYTLQTGFAAALSANAVFHTTKDSNANVSAILSSITYTQYQQVILPLQTYIWTKNNKYNIVTDWRYMKYPQYSYGLGGYTTDSNKFKIDYSNIHLYQTIMRSITRGWYAGVGYDFDYYWNIQSDYRERIDPLYLNNFKDTTKNSIVASGFTLNLLYDSRKNPINAQQGSLMRIKYRPNFIFLGSNTNWQSLSLDLRHYFKLSPSSDNVLAVWSYDWFTTGGRPPYVMLPSLGWDPNSNTGRGYIQGRYRGRNMLYLETEYRFGITRNGLIGGVIYANAASFSEPFTNRFETIAPGWGTGLRLKLNKFSKTNVAIDYSFGLNGSRGFFVNLGEVF
jgi:hypothetical protein